MKRFLMLLLILSLYGCYTNERHCKNFKTGTFSFNYSVDGENRIGKFIRTKDLNVDYFEGKIDSASIRWINDCEFIQTKINPKSRSEEAPIHMKIISTTDSSYTFEYKLAVKKPNAALRVEKGTAYLIN